MSENPFKIGDAVRDPAYGTVFIVAKLGSPGSGKNDDTAVTFTNGMGWDWVEHLEFAPSKDPTPPPKRKRKVKA